MFDTCKFSVFTESVGAANMEFAKSENNTSSRERKNIWSILYFANSRETDVDIRPLVKKLLSHPFFPFTKLYSKSGFIFQHHALSESIATN